MNADRVLVTGGAGFIGSHIVDALLQRGIEVCVLDDFSTGSRANLAAHLGDSSLRVVRGDIRKINQTRGLPEGIDAVFHEAAIASVPKSVEDPMLVHDVDLNGALQVMNYCLRHRVRRFIFASSAAVYGPILKPPAVETAFCAPGSPYGASKLSVEKYMHAYQAAYGLETVALRYFNVYGPRQRANDQYSGVITAFSKQLLASERPTIFGDGLQTRDFVYVTDVAKANLLSLDSATAPGEVFNIASGHEVTILDTLAAVSEVTGTGRAMPKFAPARKGDLRVGKSSIDKARRLLGYSPSVALREGLAEVVGSMSRPPGVVAA